MTIFKLQTDAFLAHRYIVPLKNIFQDIRFWIFILFLLRLPNITIEPLDEHGWRQSLTITMSENMYYVDANILYPRINIGGEGSGIIAGEMPIFNYLSYILSCIFGYQDWYGRLVNLLVSSVGLYFFYLTIKRLATDRVAFYATLFFAFSVAFRFARKTMPDTFSVSLVLMGVHFAWHYLDTHRKRDLLLAFFLTTCGLLSKLPAFCVLSFLVVPVFDGKYALKSKIILSSTLGIAVLAMLSWYFLWVPHLLKTYHYQLFWSVGIREGYDIFNRLYQDAWSKLEEVGLGHRYNYIVCLIGLGMLIAHKQQKILTLIGIWSAIFFVFILKTGHVFPTHTYYIIPFTPMMGLAAGYALAHVNIPNILRIAFALKLCSMSYFLQCEDFKYPDNSKYMLRLETIMDKFSSKSDKIMINSGNFNPQLMYFAHRKGWSEIMENIKQTTWMPDYKKAGLVYILIDKHFPYEQVPYQKLYEDEDFILYKP